MKNENENKEKLLTGKITRREFARKSIAVGVASTAAGNYSEYEVRMHRT